MGEMAVLIGVFAVTFAIGILLILRIPPRLRLQSRLRLRIKPLWLRVKPLRFWPHRCIWLRLRLQSRLRLWLRLRQLPPLLVTI